MEFEKYQHIERFGTTETQGIDIGTCYIFPKIDGTNASLWWNNGLQAGSRNRHLTLNNDNAGFYEWALKQENIREFFLNHPDVRLFGEFLVPHTLKTYEESAWRQFYVFDVMDDRGNYLDYKSYKYVLDNYEIKCIPPICVIDNPSYDRLTAMLEKNVYLIKDGNGVGEGIVIKNYNYKNKYGRQTWAKIVTNEFKTNHWSNDPTVVKEKDMIEEKIVDKYLTKSLAEKELAKIDNEDGWSSKQIPRLLNTVYYNLIREESWNFIKENKNPVIDYRRLNQFAINKIKEHLPHLF